MKAFNRLPFAALSKSALLAAAFSPEGQKALRGSVRNDTDDLKVIRASIEGITGKIADRDAAIKTALDKANADIASFGAVSTEVKNALEKLSKEGLDLIGRFTALEQEMSEVKKSRNAKLDLLTAGARACASDQFKNLVKNRRGHAVFSLNTITELTSGDGGAGDLIIPQRVPGIIAAPTRTLRIRDLLPKGRTSSNSVEFVLESGFTNNAAPVAEGAQKPQSTISFTLQSAAVRTLAHFIKASVQVLDDVPMLQSYIDTRLRTGLQIVEEDQLLTGDGTGQNLFGLIPQATAFDTARQKIGDTRMDILRRAMTQCRIAEYRPSAIVLHPTDWEEIELTKDSTGQYVWANPRSLLGPTLWGLPVIDSTALEEGEFLLGAFDLAAQIWDRQDARIDVSTENADDFEKNLVTIRGEERLTLTVYRPESFIYGDFDSIVST
jgi:HK97 family phage major capsid protein